MPGASPSDDHRRRYSRRHFNPSHVVRPGIGIHDSSVELGDQMVVLLCCPPLAIICRRVFELDSIKVCNGLILRRAGAGGSVRLIIFLARHMRCRTWYRHAKRAWRRSGAREHTERSGRVWEQFDLVRAVFRTGISLGCVLDELDRFATFTIHNGGNGYGERLNGLRIRARSMQVQRLGREIGRLEGVGASD